jgi:hypothetical protein
MNNVPLREPAAVGVKVTWIRQLAATASEEGQALVCEKSPLALIVPTVSAVVPVLFRVTSWVALAVFKETLPKLSDVGLTVPTGPVPLPESETRGAPASVEMLM